MPFRAVLTELVRQAPFVRGAVFCDYEGERIEAVLNDPALDTFALDLTGASYARVVEQLASQAGAQLRVLHDDDVVWVQLIRDGYYVVLLSRRGGRDLSLTGPLRDVGDALRALL